MIHLLGRLPVENFYVCVSGGIDSMTMMHFLLKSKRKFTALYFNHTTDHGYEARDFVREQTAILGVELIEGAMHLGDIDPSQSKEMNWRNCRYKFFSLFSDKGTILQAHHLNDAVETYIMTALKGRPTTIPYRNEQYNIIRPFLTTTRQEIKEWAEHNGVKWIEDPSNDNIVHDRNYVRHRLLPMVYHLNPGIISTVRDMVLARYENDELRKLAPKEISL